MCWNENISLNTFVVGTAILLFIGYNNTYTQYKLPEFNNGWFYFLIFSFTSIQLVEFFLWKSIRTKNNAMNRLFSMIGWMITRVVQPLFMILLIPKKYDLLKKGLFLFYFSVLTIVSLYKNIYNPVSFKSSIDKNGHLYWTWVNLIHYEQIVFILYVLLIFVLLFTSPLYIYILFYLLFLFVSYGVYKNTFGSMWCWISNSILLFFLIKILIVLPYLEKNKLC